MSHRDLQALYDRVARVVSPLEWQLAAPKIREILALKQQRRAVILAHNYQAPEIFCCLADVVGDSLKLAIEAQKVEADIIVQCGVYFMAETSKLLNPSKRVLIPDKSAGCSLASSITRDDVLELRRAHPGCPVVSYVNTSAEVKSAADVCCTSANAVRVVESLGVPEVIFIPDRYLAENVARQTKVRIIAWQGVCEVHELFTNKDVEDYRRLHDGVVVIAHPECHPKVIQAADFSGSTSQMVSYIENKRPECVFLVTECSMSQNIATRFPETDFVRPCNLCPHMNRISIDKILNCLRHMEGEVTIPEDIAEPARLSIERMIALENAELGEAKRALSLGPLGRT